MTDFNIPAPVNAVDIIIEKKVEQKYVIQFRSKVL